MADLLASKTPLLLVLLALPPGLPAQEPGGEVAAALAAYAEVRERSEEQRTEALQQLAPFAEREVTEVLLDELRNARTSEHAEKVLRILGARPRPGVMRDLLTELMSPSVSAGVRRAAADAVVGQGHRGVDVLARLLQRPPEPGVPGLRNTALQALAAADDDRAWRVLAGLSATGAPAERLQVLWLLAPAGDLPAVTKARLAAAVDGDLLLAAAAVRQLAERGHPRARALAEDLHQRSGAATSAVRAELVHGMAAVLHPGLYRPLLLQSASDSAQVRKAVREVASLAMEDPGFVRWLVDELPRTLPAERKAALRYLRAADPQVAAEALAGVRRQLRNPTPADLELVVTLDTVLAGDPTFVEELLVVARSSRPELRAAGLGMLADRKAEAGLPIALDSIEHPEWPVRAAAYRFLAVVRTVEAIPLLIRRVGRETPRLEQELLDTLMASTRRRFWTRELWERWWAESGEGFELPPPFARSGRSSSGGSTISYYDIPLVSSRAVFVIDTSGSMEAPVGTDRKRTRLDEAKSQLARVLKDIPRSWMFNVIPYQSSVRPVLKGLRAAKPGTVERVLAEVAELRARGGTNIHDALEAAFNDPDVDTIYLLSDGQPSVGPIVQPDELADEVALWNRSRQIAIHCIAVGMESRLLERLARESGGVYTRVR